MTAAVQLDPYRADQQQQGLTPEEDAALVALAAFLASVAAVRAVTLPGYLVDRLVALGLNRRAVRAAGKLTLEPALTGRTRWGSPLSRFGPQTMVRRMAAAEPMMRARYLLAAAMRLTKAATDGAFTSGLTREQTYLDAHRRAGQRRAKVAREYDIVARGQTFLRWQTAGDSKVDADCAALDGSVWNVDRPLMPPPGAVHPHCLLPGTTVTAPSILATSTRWYRGEVVELTTSRGDHLSVTPNHPILTAKGWVAAGLLDEGSYVVRAGFPEALALLVDPDDYQRPALIEDVVASFGKRGGVLTTAVPLSAEDFHGDGLGSEIAVIRTDGMLGNALDVSQPQPSFVDKFGGPAGDSPVVAFSDGAALLPGVLNAPYGGVSGFGVPGVLFGGPSGRHEAVGFGYRSALDAAVAQYLADGVSGGAMGPGEFVLAHAGFVGGADVTGRQTRVDYASHFASLSGEIVRHGLGSIGAALLEDRDETVLGNPELFGGRSRSKVAGFVELDRLKKVRRYAKWSGHVYNLETSTGWYVSDTILTHNCRCTAVPVSSPITPVAQEAA